MERRIFFSWQSDRPEKGGKGLLEAALHASLTQLSGDTFLDEPDREFVLDTDTKDVPGSPPIVDAIFNKIDKAAVFVADVTFVGERADKRPTPNPNVLIEYGWALKSMGYGRVISVMNTAYGEPNADTLPFDMRHLRFPITYLCPENADAEAKNTARNSLTKSLTEAIRSILLSDDYKATQEQGATRGPFELRLPEDGAARFRASGAPIGVSKINSVFSVQNPPQLKLRAGPAFWLRLAPQEEQGRDWELIEISKALNHENKLILPMSEGYRSFGNLRGIDGCGVYATPFSGEEETRAVVFGFKNGEVWSIDTYPAQAWQNEENKKQFLFPEPIFTRAINMYIPYLRNLGVTGPLQWEAGIEGIDGYTFQYSINGIPRHFGPFLTNVLSMRGTCTAGQAANEVLSPFFERIFSDAGSQRPAELRR